MKNIWKLTLLAVAAFCLASCSNDNEGNGRVMRYDSNGTKLDMFVCGVNPGTVIFF